MVLNTLHGGYSSIAEDDGAALPASVGNSGRGGLVAGCRLREAGGVRQ